MSKRRVVVTGLGIVSPVGNDLNTAWGNIVAGRSGIGPITNFDVSAFPTRIAGEVRDFDPALWIPAKDVKKMDSFIHYGVAAALMAIADAGLVIDDSNAERTGALIGSGIGGIAGIEKTTVAWHEGGPRKISPFYVPSTIINMVAGHLSIMTGIKGPNFSAVSACATSNHSIGMAMRLIQYGDADIMVAGGAEYATVPTAVGGFCSMKAMSTRNDDPQRASRPWDKDRDGFVLGEGAGVMVIEEYEHAVRRGAKIYAELAGFGMSGDAYHMTAPDTDGPRRSMLNAMQNAGVSPDQVHYLNAHGTSTPLGDKNETDAIKLAFGEDSARKLVVNSTKSMTGHLLGGAGGLESVFTVLAVHNQISPPTINIFEQDPECDLDYCANVARDMRIDVALKNNFGFGGTNGTLVFRRV